MFCSFPKGVSADVTAINGHIIWNLILTPSPSQGTPVEWTTKGDLSSIPVLVNFSLALSINHLIYWCTLYGTPRVTITKDRISYNINHGIKHFQQEGNCFLQVSKTFWAELL